MAKTRDRVSKERLGPGKLSDTFCKYKYPSGIIFKLARADVIFMRFLKIKKNVKSNLDQNLSCKPLPFESWL